jgi:hypothetical protein
MPPHGSYNHGVSKLRTWFCKKNCIGSGGAILLRFWMATCGRTPKLLQFWVIFARWMRRLDVFFTKNANFHLAHFWFDGILAFQP